MRRVFVAFVIGALIGGIAISALRTTSSTEVEAFGSGSVVNRNLNTDRLFKCGTNATGAPQETSCALSVMRRAGASPESQRFFRETHWFLDRFHEFGLVDLGEVSVPWRANANDDYVLLNGSPSVVYVEREAPSALLFADDPAYEPLLRAANSSDEVPDENDLVLWETDETFEARERTKDGIRFVFQWSLNDACHACATGYEARVALDFAKDGTYRYTDPLNICFDPSLKQERVESRAPECPDTD